MNPQLNYILAQQRIADLHRAAEHARLATDAGTRRRDSSYLSPIVRALPLPTARRVSLSRDQESPADSGAPGNDCVPSSSLAMTRYGSTNRERSHGAAPNDSRPPLDLWWMTGRESGSMAFSQPQISSGAVDRSEQLTRLVYELLDAHTDSEHLSRRPHSELLWRAHHGYLRDRQRVAREAPAHAS